jgi:hypothetical protein
VRVRDLRTAAGSEVLLRFDFDTFDEAGNAREE